MHGEFADLIPVVALAIPLAAIVGKTIVRPLAEALSSRRDHAGERVDPDTRREIEELRDRLEGLEKALARVEEEQDFQRALQGGGTMSGARSLDSK